MRVLHVASFSGNVGDNANHNGLRGKLLSVLPRDTRFDNLEIRKFYRRYDGKDRMFFNEDFAQMANEYDLVVIGGGNFFEIWLEDSSTGCTIDLPRRVLDKIKSRMLFFGLGFDTYKGSSDSTKERFLDFAEYLLSSDRILVSVRNDGSRKQLESCYGSGFASRIAKVPDGGFFLQIDDPVKGPSSEDYGLKIVVSLAQDMPDVRFRGFSGASGYALLVNSIVDYIKIMKEIRNDASFSFVPHIYSDLRVISDVINELPDHIRRNSISVGPYLVGPGAEKQVFSIYRNCDCAVSMRFHANVCPIGMNIPTIGLSTYRKILDLYNELGLPERVIVANEVNLYEAILEKTRFMLENRERVSIENLELRKRLEHEMDSFLNNLKNLMSIDNSL